MQPDKKINATVYSLDGKKDKTINMPKVFNEPLDTGLIKRAVLAIESAARQSYGPTKMAGRENTAEYKGMRHLPTHQRGINVGHARLPRLRNRQGILSGRVAGIPRVVGGPRAHPPEPRKKLEEKINKKEKKKALKSAIASTLNKELILERHAIDEKIELPLVVVNEFETLNKTSNIVKTLKALNIYSDILSAKNKRKIRAGKGKRRGRKYKHKKSLLIVTGNDTDVFKAVRNLEGVDVCKANSLNSKLLAPGAKPGRLTLWTENALKELEGL